MKTVYIFLKCKRFRRGRWGEITIALVEYKGEKQKRSEGFYV